MATIKDVASRAGASISTVSHVLNHTRRVSEDATQKVLEAVAELNYAPNSVARSLKINSTKTHRHAGHHQCQPLLRGSGARGGSLLLRAGL